MGWGAKAYDKQFLLQTQVDLRWGGDGELHDINVASELHFIKHSQNQHATEKDNSPCKQCHHHIAPILEMRSLRYVPALAYSGAPQSKGRVPLIMLKMI